MISRKSFLKSMLAGAAASVIPFKAYAQTGGNIIQTENTLPGTTDWQLTNPSANGEIQGYAGQDSINLGEYLYVYVSTTAYMFDLEVYRLGYYQGNGASLKFYIRGIPGTDQGSWVAPNPYPTGATVITSYPDAAGNETNMVDANWGAPIVLPFDPSYVPGIYIIKLIEQDTGTQWHIPFVLRDDTAAPDIFYKLPFNTDQAYNVWGGTSAYDNFRVNPLGLNDRSSYQSFNRPYWLGFGSQHLFLWEYPMARFLEELGYNVSYTTNLAIALGETTLTNAKAVITAGHDEYVSQQERAALQSALAAGVNLAWFGANNMFWQVRHGTDSSTNVGRLLINYKQSLNQPGYVPYVDPVSDLGALGLTLSTDLWASARINYPEARLLKQSWEAVALNFNAFDFVVKHANHWMYTGTGLNEGDHIPGVIGGEVDLYDLRFLSSGQTATVVGWSPYSANDQSNRITSALIVEDSSNNTAVFDAGTFFWSVALSDFQSYVYAPPAQQTGLGGWPVIPESPALRQMTANLLSRMISGSPPSTPAMRGQRSTWHSLASRP